MPKFENQRLDYIADGRVATYGPVRYKNEHWQA